MRGKRHPADYLGRRAGKLEVVAVITVDGKNTVVRCRCDCGRTEDIFWRRLTPGSAQPVRGCAMCEGHACLICGKALERGAEKTCSPECAAEHRKRYHLRFYHEKKRDDPVAREKRLKAAAIRHMNKSPEQRERDRASKRASNARLRDDPEWREKQRAYQREYARAQRAIRRADPAAYEVWLAERAERLRQYNREYAAARRAAMTPEEKAQFNARQREWARQRELEKLIALGAKVTEKLNG